MTTKQRLDLAITLFLITLVTVLGYTVFSWRKRNWDSRYIADRCERRLQQTVNPQVLQTWATNLLGRYPPGITNYAGPFVSPPGLSKIWVQAPDISMRKGTGGEEDYIYIFWGSGVLGHWGLSVGSPSFRPANSENGSRMWQPGVYFWEDLH